MHEYFGDFVFDHVQLFHFYTNMNHSSKYDYFIPEIRDFLSTNQRWLLKEANISVCEIYFVRWFSLVFFHLLFHLD